MLIIIKSKKGVFYIFSFIIHYYVITIKLKIHQKIIIVVLHNFMNYFYYHAYIYLSYNFLINTKKIDEDHNN